MGSQYLIGLDGRRKAFRDNGTKWLDSHIPLDEPIRVRCDEDGARNRQLLYARGQMARRPVRGIVHVKIALNRAHNDFARVQAYANLKRKALVPKNLLSIFPDGVLHLEC